MNLTWLQQYRSIERNIPVTIDKRFESLVHPAELESSPIHSWYRFKEGFSPKLTRFIAEMSGIEGDIRLVDPFMGSGTSLLSSITDTSLNLGLATGIEVNPFIHFVAQTKLNFTKLNARRATNFLLSIKETALNEHASVDDIPELTTVERAFSASTLHQLIHLRFIIENEFDSEEYERHFFMLAFAAILERSSCMRKSGRALKIVKPVRDYDVKQLFIDQSEKMIQDVLSYRIPSQPKEWSVHNQDVRLHETPFRNYNLALFSPPYLNHFDYTEVYKIELWMLRFVNTYKEFKELRLKTLRSHPSTTFNTVRSNEAYGSHALSEIINDIDESTKAEPFFKTIKAYIDDMYTVLSKLNNNTSQDAVICCVVANSLFGSATHNNFTPVATDLLISEIACSLGLQPEIRVARKVSRRGLSFPYGRESVLLLRKTKRSTKLNDYGAMN